jgi:hypothetical protein
MSKLAYIANLQGMGSLDAGRGGKEYNSAIANGKKLTKAAFIRATMAYRHRRPFQGPTAVPNVFLPIA